MYRGNSLPANQFQTEHTSHLRIRKITGNPATGGHSCFDVWDLSGTFYEFGCTPDSLLYRQDATQGTILYGYNLDRMIAPHDGTGTYKTMLVSYVQDCGPDSTFCTLGSSTVRDSGIRQIQYGFSSHVNSLDTVVGTVDFLYRGPRTITINGTNWTTSYGTNYNCATPPPDGTSTTLRCDGPITRGSVSPPSILSTLSLATVTSYVGKDDGTGHPDYRYGFTYQDQPYRDCYNINQQQAYCAGEHLLTNVQSTVYQNGTGHVLKPLTFGYSQEEVTYIDSTQDFPGSSTMFSGQTYWSYLTSYQDLATGASGTITYQRAYPNVHGTPRTSDGDNRYDPLHCTVHNDCTGAFSYPDDRSWSNQVVTSLTTVGQDSSALPTSTTTTYRYRLNKVGDDSTCPADSAGNRDCMGDTWIPANSQGLDKDWMDFYHGEYHGFNTVYTTSPAGDLTVDSYFSTKGWGTYETDGGNYNSGSLYQEDIYQGNAAVDSALVQRTINTYTGPDNNSCNGSLPDLIYSSCIIMMERTRTILYEGTGSGNANAPWSQHDYTYDDFTVANGQGAGYHNLLKEVITASNAPAITKKWTYQPVDTTVNGFEYFDVNKVSHSEIDDSSGHIWQCQDTTYDEGRPSGIPSPSAGWATTVKSYSDCTNPGGTAISTYKGYDAYGNTVATVDAFAAANPSLYSSHGCTVTTPPAIAPPSSRWGTGRYTACLSYESLLRMPTSATNVLGQSSSTVFDDTQGMIPTSATDINGQTTRTSYSYDSNGNRTQTVTVPLESGTYTTQSSTNVSCTSGSTLPCFEVDSHSSQYPTAIARTFYDTMGRAVETRTPGPGAGYDTIVFTTYDDVHHMSFQSAPFEVTSGTGWVDPNGAKDYQGGTPGGTATYLDALGRPLAVRDALYLSAQEPGLACSTLLSGTYTGCTNYGVGTARGDTATYAYTQGIDANNHMMVSFTDAQGRAPYSQWYSGVSGPITANINQQRAIQFNVLGGPTTVTVTNLAPQSGQSTTSVTSTAHYDDLGRLQQTADPDRGMHTYTADANGRTLTDVSGTRTLGYNYDLLGRVGCVQDSAPAVNATGACTSGSHPFIQNTYDTSVLGTQGSSDFPLGRLTQSVATNSYPDGSQATVTEKMQHDQRGRLTTTALQLGLPGGWNVATALPTYKMAVNYNDANQVTTTTTSTNPVGQGFTFTQVYDPTTGALTGLGNTGGTTANLATQTYNAQAQVNAINFQTTTGTALAQEQFGYDADLRPSRSRQPGRAAAGHRGRSWRRRAATMWAVM